MSKQTNTILISGGSRGIGRAIAALFAAQRWQIIIVARSAEAGQGLQAYWKVNYPDSVLHYLAEDLSNMEACTNIGAWLHAHDIELDVLVNNLGAFTPGMLLASPHDLPYFMQTNVYSAHFLTSACLPAMRKRSTPLLVSIGSVAARDLPLELASYALSKHTLEIWHQLVAAEVAQQGISTALIRPGATYTSSWDGVPVDPDTLLRPEDVAALVLEAWQKRLLDKQQEFTIEPTGI